MPMVVIVLFFIPRLILFLDELEGARASTGLWVEVSSE